MRADTYMVEVPDVGSFEVRRPVMRTAIRMEVEYARLTEGVENLPVDLQVICRIMSYLKVMVVSGPDGWDVDNLDPYSDQDTAKLREVYDAITAEEARFRSGGKVQPEAEGAGA
jgi:hypothetical protein